jgi:hypothetical protein
MKFIINRNTWRCGGKEGHVSARGRGETRLLNAEGFLCCLGQISLQLGATREDIRNMATPEDVTAEATSALDLLRCPSRHFASFEATELADNAMIVNDDHLLSEVRREKELVELFAGYGHELVFVG